MLVALVWWSYLLYVKNNDAFWAKAELLKITMAAQGQVENLNDFQVHPEYLALEKKYTRQKNMILGEAFVLGVSMFIGIWIINRGYQGQVKAARQSRNFLLSITHELKSPIASIRLILETFKKRDLPSEQIKKFSSNALSETERLYHLVDNLLLAAKLETSFESKPENIELKPLAESLSIALRQKYPDARIELNIPEKTTINMDRSGLTSIFVNLMENGIKYAKNVQEVNVSYSNTKNQHLLTFRDSGIGISDKEKKQVFDKFYRIGNEDTRTTKGTGLGLYIVKQVVEIHEGTISIKDNPEGGSVFVIQLPITQDND